jgi:hypothetical protein
VRTLGLTACFSLLLLATAAPAVAQSDEHPAPALLPAPDDALTDALDAGELTEAEYALERARSAFQLGSVRREFGDVERPGGHDATLLLRDLALRQDELSGADRTAATRLLARPGGGDTVAYGTGWTSPEANASPACSTKPGVNLCVHWVDRNNDPDVSSSAAVDDALRTLEDVWAQEIIELGYRPPQDDADSLENGGNAGLDVYLDDLGDDGVFGYCTSDDPERAFAYSVSAYCVLDNDYSSTQYGTAHTANEFLQVTAAHEFHHASQFAYDWGEDAWLMEGTATNIEEEVFPDVNDNVSFLKLRSPLTRPASPLDRSDSAYGSWIFWRYLQEKVAGGDPTIVREIWERADATRSDDYSLQAVQKEVAQRGQPFVDAFVRFGAVNRLLNYADAKPAGYPATPTAGSWYLGPSRPATRWQSWKIDHLATRFFSFAPGASVARDARLRLRLTLPRTGARAAVIVVNTDGSRSTRYVTPNTSGDAVRVARFGRGAVARVHLVLSNGSTRTNCWTRVTSPTYSCLGTPTGDGLRFGFKAELVP